MERKIGEIFEYNGDLYQCVRDNSDRDCGNCHFSNTTCKYDVIGYCASFRRDDRISVCFKKLEKLGPPYKNNRRAYQLYKLAMPVDMALSNLGYQIVGYDVIEIEIKQNQKDMEENKLNLKPFDLEAARSGKPVCTRDGRKARIICFDRFDREEANKRIVTLVQDDNRESLYCHDLDGKYLPNNNLDLMMLPEKHEGWINVYKSADSRYAGYASVEIYKTKEQAIQEADEDVLDTIKIEWNE